MKYRVYNEKCTFLNFREVDDVKLQHEIQNSEDPRYDGLDRKDRNKVGFHVRFFNL